MWGKIICYYLALGLSIQSFAIINSQSTAPHLSSSVAILIMPNGVSKINENEGLCSGTLINHDTVITAAHCIKNLAFYANKDDLEEIRIYSPVLGEEKLLKIIEAKVANEFIFVPGMDLDVGFVKLKNKIDLDKEGIQVSSVLSTEKFQNLLTNLGEYKLLMNGFGHTSLGPITSSSVELGAFYTADLKLDSYRGVLSSTLGKESIFYWGDSGGGIHLELEGKWYLLGVASHVGNYDKKMLKVYDGIKYLDKSVPVESLTNVYSILNTNLCWITLDENISDLKMSDEACELTQNLVYGPAPPRDFSEENMMIIGNNSLALMTQSELEK